MNGSEKDTKAANPMFAVGAEMGNGDITINAVLDDPHENPVVAIVSPEIVCLTDPRDDSVIALSARQANRLRIILNNELFRNTIHSA